jgi:iron complex outermembrane receptor protein
MYDKGPLSARLAWNWRSKNLQGVNVNGTKRRRRHRHQPGQPDLRPAQRGLGAADLGGRLRPAGCSVFYNITENMSVGLEAQNLTDSKYKQLMQQNIGDMGRAWFKTRPPLYCVAALSSF